MTDEEFCKIETAISGDEIDKVEQLIYRSFTGRELKEYLEQAFAIHNVSRRSEQFKCDCCNGTGMVEGDYRDELESCLTCNGRGTFKLPTTLIVYA